MGFINVTNLNSSYLSTPFETTNSPYIFSNRIPNSKAKINYIFLGKKEISKSLDTRVMDFVFAVGLTAGLFTAATYVPSEPFEALALCTILIPIAGFWLIRLFHKTITYSIVTSSIAVAEKILGQNRTDLTDDVKFNLAVFSRQINRIQEKDYANFLTFLEPKFVENSRFDKEPRFANETRYTEEQLYAYAYGEMLYNGWGLLINQTAACGYYLSAAARGVTEAQNALGHCTQYGHGVQHNEKRALELYRQAIDQGLGLAQYNIGECYLAGYGVKRNINEAIKWFEKAANQDNPDAQTKLGWCYLTGYGVEKNLDIAIDYYNKAEKQGNDEALFALGKLYEKGIGVQKNVERAFELYKKAEAQGSWKAKNRLKRKST